MKIIDILLQYRQRQIFSHQKYLSYGNLFIFKGPDEDTPRPMECLEFVSRAPTNLFRLRTSYPPYQRTKPDLNSLLSVAEDLLDPANTELPGDVTTIAEPN